MKTMEGVLLTSYCAELMDVDRRRIRVGIWT